MTQVGPLQFHSCLGFDCWDASVVNSDVVLYIRQKMASVWHAVCNKNQTGILSYDDSAEGIRTTTCKEHLTKTR